MKKSYHSMAVPKQLANTTFLYPSCPPDRAATCGSWRRAVVGCISPLSVGTTREANPERTSEWIPGWTVLDRDPLPLGELLPIGRPADPPTVAGGAAAAKRDVRFVMHRLIVDVQQARMESVADRHRATDGARDDRGREPVLRLVGEPASGGARFPTVQIELAAPCRLVHPWCVIHCDPPSARCPFFPFGRVVPHSSTCREMRDIATSTTALRPPRTV